MKEETLQKVKKLYEGTNKKIREKNKNNEKILALQEEKVVTEYLELRGLKKIKKIPEIKISEIYQCYINQVKAENTNHIYIYAGYYDVEGVYSYINIETGEVLEVYDNFEFELMNNIIHLDEDLSFETIHDEYYPIIQEDFLLEAIKNGQNYAKRYVMEYNKKM